jgi:hypothetical protein
VRGGISVGDFHIRERLIFGPALVAAYDLEQAANNPRIVLDEPARDAKRTFRAAARGPHTSVAPLIEDGDGRVFVDYLGLQLDEPDAEASLRVHRDVVSEKLNETRNAKSIWEKYRWVAEYHNATLRLAPDSFKQGVDLGLLRVNQAEQTWGFRRFE